MKGFVTFNSNLSLDNSEDIPIRISYFDNRVKLGESIAERLGISKADSKRALDGFINSTSKSHLITVIQNSPTGKRVLEVPSKEIEEIEFKEGSLKKSNPLYGNQGTEGSNPLYEKIAVSGFRAGCG